MEAMDYDEEVIDYSQDPYVGQSIFCGRGANPSVIEAAPSHPTILPVVELPGFSTSPLCFGSLSLGSLGLDIPPLSLGTLNLLSAISPPSPNFDLLPSFNPVPPLRSPHPVLENPNSLPSECFDSPVIIPKSATPLKNPGSDPLMEQPSALRTGKRKVKCVKKSSKDLTITFGEDIPMGEVVDKANRVLVGHVQGRAYSATRLTNWVQEIWGGILQELPEVQSLARGWFALHFSKAEYTDLILAKYWHIEMTPVLLKRWSPLFDPEWEQIGAGPIWVRLPGLPLQFWSEAVFIKIGNALGTYLEYDKTYVQTKKRALARILVHLDTREGLEEKITLKWRHYTRIQILDYEGVSFRCRRCHKVGHVFK